MRRILTLAVFLLATAVLAEPAIGSTPTGATGVILQASGDDWVSVADASGHVILGQLLHKGDHLALPEGPGYVFTVGNAAATNLLVDGQPAPPLGAPHQVVSNQPIDARVIAAGHLPAQLAAARFASGHVVPTPTAELPAPAEAPPAAIPVPRPTAHLQRAAMVVPVPQPGAEVAARHTRHASARIVVQASGDDWVSVADASGHVILGQLLRKGDHLALPDGPGYTFTAGDAAATTLLVDGQPAPPLGAPHQVVSNQPIDAGLIAAGRLPAQLAAARFASAPAAPAPQARPVVAPIRPVAMTVQTPPLQAANTALPSAPAPLAPSPTPATAPPRPLALAPSLFQPAEPSALGSTIALNAGAGQVVSLAVPAASVFTADPKVADVRPASPTSLFVLGVAPGETTIAALDQAGHPIVQYRVIVTPSGFGPDAASAAIARLVPDAHITLSATPDGITVSGSAPTAADAAEVMSIVHGYIGSKQTVHDELTVYSDVQVSLQVRIAEMSRTITRELGVNWQELGSTGGKITANFMSPSALAFLTTAANTFNLTYHSGNTNVNAIIDALAQDQLARLLAEPNLTAMSGQTASFLVGGEFPIPVSLQNGEISVQFQPYGVSLSFIPTVLADNRISLRVRPEVSELTNQGAVQLSEGNSTIQIPALLVRRTETTVELGSGQSFAIAGLLQDQTTQVDQGVPGLSELPVLGALFNSNSFQRNETELVIVVTPYIVRPVSSPSALRLPTQGWAPPSDLDRILFHRQIARGVPSEPTTRIPGDAGFITQ